MNLASLIEKAKSENVELDIKSACFAMGFVAGQEARKSETDRPICVTVGNSTDNPRKFTSYIDYITHRAELDF